MQRGIFSLSLVAIMAAAVVASADSMGSSSSSSTSMAVAPTVVMPGDVKWGPVPGMTGVQYGVLYGDPTAAGSQYAVRYKMVDGFKFPVHTHPLLEQVTVLSGTFMVGVGNKWDASKMTALAPGSFVAIPPNLPHYAQAKGEVTVEVHGIGPDKMVLVK